MYSYFAVMGTKCTHYRKKLDSCSIIQGLMESCISEPIYDPSEESLCVSSQRQSNYVRRGTREGREYTATSISWVSTEPFHIRLANIL